MDQTPRRRFRVRISTLLLVVAIVALLMVVIMQELRIEQMRQAIYTPHRAE
jgi:hypothetical protein